ncbi:MAG: ABC transporter ATP-binding protein [Pseudomonadota bacterium]
MKRRPSLIRRFWSEHLYQYRWKLVLALGAIILVAGSTSLYPLLINWAFDSFDEKDWWAIQTLPFIILLAAALKGLSLYIQVAATQRVVTRVECDVQQRLYAHLIAADLSQIAAHSGATWAQRFTTDVRYIREGVARVISHLIRDGVTMLGLLIAMIYLDWVLSLIAMVIIPLALAPIARIGKRMKRISRRAQEETGAMAGVAAETLEAARVIKSFRLEAYAKMRAAALFEALRALALRGALQKARTEPILEFLGGAAVTAILVVIGWRILSGSSTIGEFTGFLGALLLAGQPMRNLSNLHVVIQEASAALIRVYTILDTPPTISDRPAARAATFAADPVRLEGVTFAYAGGAPALKSVSFEAPAGKTTAIVGRSGAGKSTVFNLIARFYDPTQGAVRIGGEDVGAVTLDSLRARVALVTQDVMLFDDTVRANIALGRPGATEAEIIAAAQSAGAHDFITRAPEGYDSPVGVAGGRFSGGERQRIALARAFLKDAPILLLDEATSALDAESEAVVRAALTALSRDRTTLVIAHRLSTVEAADRIIVLDRGEVAEVGTHTTLMADNGLYAKLSRMQLTAA